MESKDPSIVISALEQFGLGGQEIASLREARRSFERSYILAVLRQHHWRVGAAARRTSPPARPDAFRPSLDR